MRSPTGRRRARCSDRAAEHGTALVEFTWLAILLMVPLLYVVLAVFEVQRATYGVSTASRAAGRAFVQAPDEARARGDALAAADLALGDQGVPRDRRTLAVLCRPQPGNCLAPGSIVTVVVSTSVPLPIVPDFLGEQRPSIPVSSEHTVPYGTYREDRP